MLTGMVPETEKNKRKNKATIRCIPLNNTQDLVCIYSGKPNYLYAYYLQSLLKNNH